MLNRKNLSIACLIIISLFLAPFVRADIYIKPAKLGVMRLELYPLVPATLTRTFEVKNLYNYTIQVNIKPSNNFVDILQIPEGNFTLQPNESKTVQYTVTVKEAGTYEGGAIISASSLVRPSNIAYQNDLKIIVTKHNIIPEIFLGVIVLAILVPIVYLAYKKKIFKIKIKKKHLTLLSLIAFSFLLVSSAQAAKVAMIVKSSASLSDIHEKKVYTTLENMNYAITLVDKYTSINYNNYDLIVVAGRPTSADRLDDFVANLPVNDIPTIAIDYYYVDKWGWVEPQGKSTLYSNQPQSVYIKEENPLTDGYSLNQKVYVHTIQGKTTFDLVKGYTNLTFVATANKQGTQGTIAYGLPNTGLTNNRSVSNHSAVIFFGVTYTYYWTDDTVQLFKNSVDWLLNLDFNPPTTPALTAPPSSRTANVRWDWTVSNHSSGIKNYQFQLSDSPDFNTTSIDTTTSSLYYTVNNLQDEKTYYARVRALNYLQSYSEWSNTAKTIIDLSDIIVKVISPEPNTTVKAGDSIFVNATVQATREITSCFATIENQLSSLTYDPNTTICSGTIIAPNVASGLRNLTVSATNYLGTTNSTDILINVEALPAPAQSSSSGGSWGYTSAPIIDIDANDVEVYENSESTFTIKVKNGGTDFLHAVKVSLQGTDLKYDVQPNMVDLDLGKSQEFKITLHVPDNSTGQREITIKALSYETARTKKITLTILPKLLISVLQAVSIELPTFYEGEVSTINITIQNTGNLTTTATTSISLPENWSAVSVLETSEINPGEQVKFSFVVIPSNVSGPIKFDVSYLVNGQEKKFSESTSTTVSSKPFAEESITGMLISALLLPQVFVPLAVAVILLLAFLFRKEIPKPKGLSQLFGIKENALVAPRRKIKPTSNYLRWERKYAKG
jgi:hypothetical protein